MRNGFERWSNWATPKDGLFRGNGRAEVKLIVNLVYEGGIYNMNYSVSNTASTANTHPRPRVVTGDGKAAMKDVLTSIQNGTLREEPDARGTDQPAELQGHARRCDGHEIQSGRRRSSVP